MCTKSTCTWPWLTLVSFCPFLSCSLHNLPQVLTISENNHLWITLLTHSTNWTCVLASIGSGRWSVLIPLAQVTSTLASTSSPERRWTSNLNRWKPSTPSLSMSPKFTRLLLEASECLSSDGSELNVITMPWLWTFFRGPIQLCNHKFSLKTVLLLTDPISSWELANVAIKSTSSISVSQKSSGTQRCISISHTGRTKTQLEPPDIH